MKIVVKAVRGNIWKGETVMGNHEKYPFVLNSDTGEYQVQEDSIGKVDWGVAMKSLLPNQKVKPA